jgi:hypothetical protein
MQSEHANAMLIEQEPARIVASEVSSLYAYIGPDPLANVRQRSSVLATSHAARSAKQTISVVFTSNHGAIALRSMDISTLYMSKSFMLIICRATDLNHIFVNLFNDVSARLDDEDRKRIQDVIDAVSRLCQLYRHVDLITNVPRQKKTF